MKPAGFTIRQELPASGKTEVIVANVLGEAYHQELRKQGVNLQGKRLPQVIVKSAPCKCHKLTGRWQAEVPLLGLQLLVISGQPHPDDFAPLYPGFPPKGLYGVVSWFTDAAEYPLGKETAEYFVRNFLIALDRA